MHKYIGTDLDKDYMFITRNKQALIKSYGKEGQVNLKEIGIRPGEKMHEEMISKEEWLRTIEWENYLITAEYCNQGDMGWSYNSEDSLMGDDQTYNFLVNSGVIK